jgi:hypothetical protein
MLVMLHCPLCYCEFDLLPNCDIKNYCYFRGRSNKGRLKAVEFTQYLHKITGILYWNAYLMQYGKVTKTLWPLNISVLCASAYSRKGPISFVTSVPPFAHTATAGRISAKFGIGGGGGILWKFVGKIHILLKFAKSIRPFTWQTKCPTFSCYRVH